MVMFDDRRRLAAEKGLAGACMGEYAPASRSAETKGAMMHLIMLLLAIHILAAVFWVGGMAFAIRCCARRRRALTPVRLPLWRRVSPFFPGSA